MAPLNQVARRAGVGQGSLYRHFPDRIALAVAVFDDNITALENLAARPGATLSDLFDRVAAQAMTSTALVDLISSGRDGRAEHLSTRMTAVAAALLSRDQERGLIARRVEPADVMLAINMLAMLLARTPAADRNGAAARARAIFRTAFTAGAAQ